MKIFGKKENVPVVEHKEVDAAEVWVVSWNSLLDRGYHTPTLVNCERRAKAFLSKDIADEFADSLRDAMRFLQCSFYLDIRVEKQE